MDRRIWIGAGSGALSRALIDHGVRARDQRIALNGQSDNVGERIRGWRCLRLRVADHKKKDAQAE
jgi:hypothetical protein